MILGFIRSPTGAAAGKFFQFFSVNAAAADLKTYAARRRRRPLTGAPPDHF